MTRSGSHGSGEVTAAWVIAALIVALAALAALDPPPAIPLGLRAMAEHVQEMHLSDTTRQRHAYLVLFLATTAATVVLARSDRLRARVVRWAERAPLDERALRWLGTVTALAILYFCRGRSLKHLASFGLVALLVAIHSRPRMQRALGAAAAVTVAACAAIVLVPGLLTRPDLTTTVVPPAIVEAHYVAVVSQGDRLSQGYRLFSEVMPQYGVLLPALLGWVEKTRGLLSFGAHIRLVQVAQIAFALLAFACYWLWSGRRFLTTALVFIPVLAMVGTRHNSVFCPNQSGWRFAGFPLGMLILLLTMRARRRPAALLGLASGGLALFNPETAAAVTFGYLFFLLSERREDGSAVDPFPVLRQFIVYALILPLAFAIVFRLAFGYFPSPFGTSSRYALVRFSAGYGGLTLYFAIGWIVMLVCSIVEILRGALSRAPLDTRARARGAVAVVMLVWFSYFFNRADEWNLWINYFLFGFFIVEMLGTEELARYASAARGFALPVGAAIVAMFLVGSAQNIVLAMRDGLGAVRHRSPPPPTVESGVGLPADYASLLARRAAFVARRAKETPLYYFTGNIYAMPIVSGVTSRPGDAYEMYNNDEFDRFAAGLVASGPPQLLFDDASSLMIGSKERNHYYGRLKDKIAAAYALRERVDGWEVWERARSGDTLWP
jgi:hypothetical protein